MDCVACVTWLFPLNAMSRSYAVAECCLRRMLSYSLRMKFEFDSYSSKAASSKYQVSHALMSCLFDPNPDPNPNQVALGGLHPGVSSVHLPSRQRPTAFFPGKVRRSRPLRWHYRVALSGLLR